MQALNYLIRRVIFRRALGTAELKAVCASGEQAEGDSVPCSTEDVTCSTQTCVPSYLLSLLLPPLISVNFTTEYKFYSSTVIWSANLFAQDAIASDAIGFPPHHLLSWVWKTPVAGFMFLLVACHVSGCTSAFQVSWTSTDLQNWGVFLLLIVY